MTQNSQQRNYKASLIEFVKTIDWDWFVTIGIGWCPPDEETLRRLRLIEAKLCKKFLLKNFHKLPDDQRFFMLVAFEGDQALGTRHAHILVRSPCSYEKV